MVVGWSRLRALGDWLRERPWAAAGLSLAAPLAVATAWPLIRWPGANVHGIAGAAAMAGVHPHSHGLRLVLLVLSGAVCWRWVGPRFSSPSPSAGRWAWVVLTGALLAWAAGRTALFALDPVPVAPGLDLLHEGEQLAPAWNTWRTGGLWTESFYVHGLFRDGLGIFAIWTLDGEPSVGAVRLQNAAMRLTAKLMWAGLAVAAGLKVARRTGALGGAALAAILWAGLVVCEESSLVYLDAREAPALVALIAVVATMGASRPIGWALVGVLGLLAGLTSVERGAFVGLTAAVVALMVPPDPGRRARALGGLVGGVAAGMLLLWALVGTEELSQALADFVLLAGSIDFYDASPYPQPDLWGAPGTTLPLVLLCVAWLAAAAAPRDHDLFGLHVLFAVGATVFYRYALTAPTGAHIQNALPLVVGALALLVWRLAVGRRLGAPTLLMASVAVGLWSARSHLALAPRLPGALAALPTTISQGLDRPDTDFLDPGAQAALPMLQEALGDEPCLFVYPQFPAWYFLLRGTPCTRHLMRTYMAATADQAEVIEILDHERPLHILLDAPYEDLEGGVGVAERLPELDRWIRGHHVPGAAESGWQLGQRRVLRRDR